MRLFLLRYGRDINASQEDKYEFVINIASGKIRFEEIVSWLEKPRDKTAGNTRLAASPER
jgi:death-on-curing protein